MMRTNPSSVLYPFDRLVLGFSLFMILMIIAFGRPLSEYLDETAFYCGAIILVLVIARYFNKEHNRFHEFIRLLYPLFLFTFFYRTMGGLMYLHFGEFLDWQLTTFEKMILGVHPTLYIDRYLLNVWLNEIFSFCYVSYYFMIAGLLLPLFFTRKYELLKRSLAAICLAFFISYIIFTLYPIEGPRYHFANQFVNSIDGFVFRELNQFVIAKGALHGGCMPSSHVAVALVVLLICWRHFRPIGWVLLPLNVGLAIATVWGRYHYVSDIVVGVAVGLFSVNLIWKYHDRWTQPAKDQVESKETVGEHVP